MHRFPFTSILRICAGLALALSIAGAALLSPPVPASAAAGINRYVSPSGSNTGDCSSAASPCQTITYALGQSGAGDTLLLDVGVYAEHLTINQGIRIVQNPAKPCPTSFTPCVILDGSSNGRVIDITSYSAQVSLEKLAIRNGQVTDSSGAGIRNSGILIIDDVSLYNNHILVSNPTDPLIYEYRGGAIDNQHALTLRSSAVLTNSAYDGGGISSPGSSLLVQNTQIYNNSATRFGGGIMVPYGDTSTLENTTLYGNTAANAGGMYIGKDGIAARMGAQHYFRNVTISGNSASSAVGGLWSVLRVDIDHSTLAANTAPGAGSDLTLEENQVGVPGFTYPHSIVTSTIVDHPSASAAICSITGAGSFDLSGGNNLSSDASCDFNQTGDQQNTDPHLLPLANNGGYVWTRALPFGSKAIDHGGPYALGADARGVLPQDGDRNGSVVPDVGAYEFIPPSAYLPFVTR